jgi:hypothetical protein
MSNCGEVSRSPRVNLQTNEDCKTVRPRIGSGAIHAERRVAQASTDGSQPVGAAAKTDPSSVDEAKVDEAIRTLAKGLVNFDSPSWEARSTKLGNFIAAHPDHPKIETLKNLKQAIDQKCAILAERRENSQKNELVRQITQQHGRIESIAKKIRGFTKEQRGELDDNLSTYNNAVGKYLDGMKQLAKFYAPGSKHPDPQKYAAATQRYNDAQSEMRTKRDELLRDLTKNSLLDPKFLAQMESHKPNDRSVNPF